MSRTLLITNLYEITNKNHQPKVSSSKIEFLGELARFRNSFIGDLGINRKDYILKLSPNNSNSKNS